MSDSLAVVVDSLVKHSLAVQDSLTAAKTSGIQAFLETPWFKLGWPIATGLAAFYGARRVKQGDAAKERADRRKSAAEKAALFLSHSAMMLEAIDIRLEKEGAVMLQRGSTYAPAQNVIEHLDTFASVEAHLEDLRDNVLIKNVIDWERMARSELNELIDYRTMAPGTYTATHAPGKADTLEARFGALRAALLADKESAKKLAEILKGIAEKA